MLGPSLRMKKIESPPWAPVPVFLKKHITTCDFLGGPDPLDPPLGIIHYISYGVV